MTTLSLRHYCLKLLARREYSSLELKTKLLAKGFNSLQIETELQELAEEGLQSNARFTEAFIRERIRLGYGPRTIHYLLSERGIEEPLIEQYISVYSDSFWYGQLQAVWERKFAKPEVSPMSLTQRARQYRFLAQRGFEPYAIHRLLKQVDNEE